MGMMADFSATVLCYGNMNSVVEGKTDMESKALYVRLEAKPGKENEVEQFLKTALPLVQEEPDTTVWFATRMGASTFGIFDVFPNEKGRNAHLSGKLATALMDKADDLFLRPPSIEKVDVLATKLRY
jgi:quinol monooxygenase YgiN